MDRFEQAVAVLALVMGLALVREGLTELSRNPVLVLAGPPGAQKTAQAEFLKTRYALRVVTAEELSRDLVPDDTPIFVEIADRHLESPPLNVDWIQTHYPEADIWTLDGTHPPEVVSATLQRLLDGHVGRR